MPGFDRSGPMGEGPMTGGARGYCNPENAGSGRRLAGATGFGRGLGRGLGFRGGRGSGRGMRRGYGRAFAPSLPVYAENTGDELGMLKQQVDSVKNTLDSINRRIADLEK